jgi:hypothetical protein
MAAEGPPPPGVSRNSLDSAFGGAQRALQLSALSMPERIAYMQVRGLQVQGLPVCNPVTCEAHLPRGQPALQPAEHADSLHSLRAFKEESSAARVVLPVC